MWCDLLKFHQSPRPALQTIRQMTARVGMDVKYETLKFALTLDKTFFCKPGCQGLTSPTILTVNFVSVQQLQYTIYKRSYKSMDTS